MEFDIFGKTPTSAEGTYFRCDIWTWPHLVQLLHDLCPEEAQGYQDWLSNDGHGLDAADARNLGRRLEALRAQGSIEAYLRNRSNRLEGTRELFVRTLSAVSRSGWGNNPVLCAVIHDEFSGLFAIATDLIPLEITDVDELIRFVAASGGFSIW